MCCCGLKISLDFVNHGEIVEWAAYLCGIKTAGKKDRTHSETQRRFFFSVDQFQLRLW